MSLIVYPNQLFEKKYIPDVHTIILYEHPDFFTKYNFNRLKLLMHRASMKEYARAMAKYYRVVYVEFHQKFVPPKGDLFMFFQPNKMKTYGTVIPSPNFLCFELFEKYRTKTDKFVFNNFYNWTKAELDIIPNIKSKDKYNRNKIPTAELGQLPADVYFNVDAAAQRYINKHFPDNVGPRALDKMLFPTTRRQAKGLVRTFIKKLAEFGRYQDALVFDGPNCLYHSCLSSALNIGLLNPRELIDAVIATKAPINATEAFIRQLFWREYQLYCYTYVDWPGPYFKPRTRLSPKWYTGSLGIDPLDITIKKAFACGYLHHIERLMIVGNYMLLSGLSPRDGFRWFMEFSADSYEWVMHQNVFDMVFATSGTTMSRIYISSSNYIIKMSNVKRGDWADKWDALFHKFLKENKGKVGYPYE